MDHNALLLLCSADAAVVLFLLLLLCGHVVNLGDSREFSIMRGIIKATHFFFSHTSFQRLAKGEKKCRPFFPPVLAFIFFRA